jgi:flagellar protein FlgJ
MDIKTKPIQAKVPEASAAEAQLKNVAALYEKQFLREMVKQMRTTVSESELMPSSFGEKYYREQLDHQYVESWGDRGGIGLGKLIYDQLMDRYGERLGIRVPSKQANRGPLPLSQKDQWTGEIQDKNRAIRFERKDANDGKPATIESPWAGSWLGTFKLENGMQVAKIKHDGVQSMFVGDFQFGDRKVGDPVEAGENLGVLSLDAKSFLWKLEE